MGFLVAGLNHKSALLDVRETITFSPSKVIEALKLLQTYPYIEECLILSTCNRVEIYIFTGDDNEGLNSLKSFLYTYHNLKCSIDQYLYSFRGSGAIQHIFRVVSSLDSMVIGENQIQYQVKRAYFNAKNYLTAGRNLSLIFQKALSVGKEVRSLTNIGKGVVSISSVAVELAKDKLNNLSGKNILIIGAGKIGELTAKSLAGKGIKSIFVANRTYKLALRLARKFGGKAIKFDQMSKALSEADIIISSTSAPHYILNYKDVIFAIEKRDSKPLFLIDLGVPRNIEQRIADIENIYLYNIDDLRKVSYLNLRERLKEAKIAEEIVKERAECFYNKVCQMCLYEYLPR